MSFPEAVRSVLTKYATFSGRARRTEYWFFALFSLVVSIVAAVVDGLIGTSTGLGGTGLVSGLLTLALLPPSIAVTVRRLHDTDRSGWWIFIGLVPLVGFIALIVFTVSDSNPRDNRFGPNPKHGVATGYAG